MIWEHFLSPQYPDIDSIAKSAREEIVRCGELTIDSPTEARVQADGEFIGTLPLTVTLRPRALKVLVPAGK